MAGGPFGLPTSVRTYRARGPLSRAPARDSESKPAKYEKYEKYVNPWAFSVRRMARRMARRVRETGRGEHRPAAERAVAAALQHVPGRAGEQGQGGERALLDAGRGQASGRGGDAGAGPADAGHDGGPVDAALPRRAGGAGGGDDDGELPGGAAAVAGGVPGDQAGAADAGGDRGGAADG